MSPEHVNGAADEFVSDQPEIQIDQPTAAKSDLNGILEETIRRKADDLRVEEARFVFQQKRARLFAASGLFGRESNDPRYQLSESKAIAQCMVRIEIGESMGFTAAESMQGIDIINNRAAISAQLRAARMQARGYTWELEWHSNAKGECEGVTVWGKFKGEPMKDRQGQQVSVSYLKSDAERMMTTVTEWKDRQKTTRRASILEKDNWKMSPRNMYFARAITNFQRWYAPGVLSVNLLSSEEAMDLDSVIEETDAVSQHARGSVEAARQVAITKLKAMGVEVGEDGEVKPTVGVMIPRDHTGAPVFDQTSAQPEMGKLDKTAAKKPNPRNATTATRQDNIALISALIEQHFPEGGNAFATAMVYAFGNNWREWQKLSAGDIEDGLRLFQEQVGKEAEARQ